MIEIKGLPILFEYKEYGGISKEDVRETISKGFYIQSRRINERRFKVKEDSYEFGANIVIDRYSAEMMYLEQGRKTYRTCKSVTNEEFKRAFKEWEEYASEQTKIWNAERKNQLDNRKL